jgi:hypothetical protein
VGIVNLEIYSIFANGNFKKIMLRKIVLFVLFIVLIGFMLNNSLFRHIHILSDGTLVEHAHPFAESTGRTTETSHSHTSEELVLLNLFFHAFQIVVAGVFLLIAVFYWVVSLITDTSKVIISLCVVKHKQLRAPPAYF